MSRVGDWFRSWRSRGQEDGPQQIRDWAAGTAGPSGYTYGTHYVVTGLMVLGGAGYFLSKYVLLVALGMCIVIMGGRRMLENQVRRDISDLEEAKKQYGRTKNTEYLTFMKLRVEQMLRDNRMLRPETKTLLTGYLDWAQKRLH